MTTFVDTSALYAVLDRDDESHVAVAPVFRALLDDEWLVTSSYVVVETTALVQSRLGVAAARDLHEKLVPALDVSWVEEDVHRAAVAALLAADRRDVSLVDRVSFELMRRRSISKALAVDAHFVEAGFDVLPTSGHGQ
ncbi:MAG: type II toxin-antitoxin system VapC family toxin [Gaiella sp.]